MSTEKGFGSLLIISFLLLIIVSFAGGYFLSNSLKQPSDLVEPNQLSQNSPSPTPTLSKNSNKDWSKIIFRDYGLSFKIPAGWMAEEYIAYNTDGLPNIVLRDQNADPFIGGSLQIIVRDNPNQLTAKEYVVKIHIPEIKQTIKENNYEEANIMIFDFQNSKISPFKVMIGDAVKLDGSYNVAMANSFPVYFVSSDKRIIEIIGNTYTSNEGNESGGKVETEGEAIISTIELD